MGPVDTSLNYAAGITSIMMVGLQGAGKTTTTGKLARYLLDKGRRSSCGRYLSARGRRAA